ncbi:hypothetical protein [Methylotuvimicrobium alcaliphilum]|nr:hypothetical protein [Methylotuvimicrobium alcaliphilum]
MSSIDHFDNLSGRLWVAVLSVQTVPYIATLLTLLFSIAPNYYPGLETQAIEGPQDKELL